MSTLLWVLWIVSFVVLEVVGARRTDDGAYTLTNRVRAVMRAHPVLRYAIRAGIAVGLVWLAHHFLIVDPSLSHGA
jgi:hypothetical protein